MIRTCVGQLSKHGLGKGDASDPIDEYGMTVW